MSKLDFTPSVYTGYYEHGNNRYCYTVYPEFYPHEDGEVLYDNDGLIIVLITPLQGTICLTFKYEYPEWKLQTSEKPVDENLVKTILKQYNTKTKRKLLIKETKTH